VVRPSVNDGWLTQIGRGEQGPYHSRDVALRVAIASALQRRRAGLPALVALKDETGAIRAQRCLCERFAR
jgi:hypothetical protein